MQTYQGKVWGRLMGRPLPCLSSYALLAKGAGNPFPLMPRGKPSRSRPGDDSGKLAPGAYALCPNRLGGGPSPISFALAPLHDGWIYAIRANAK